MTYTELMEKFIKESDFIYRRFGIHPNIKFTLVTHKIWYDMMKSPDFIIMSMVRKYTSDQDTKLFGAPVYFTGTQGVCEFVFDYSFLTT